MQQTQIATTPSFTELKDLIQLYLQLGKFRLSMMVTFTSLVGYLLSNESDFKLLPVGILLAGTLLVAMGANGLNQWWEQERDGRMLRTRQRPLPSGKLSSVHACTICLLWTIAGLFLLAQLNLLTALLAAFVWFSYLFLYTPLKTRSSLAILAGAITGALPPVMGWTAATGEVGLQAWALGCILYIWQIPHFLALAALYQMDYQRGGYKMLPDDPEYDHATRSIIVVFSAALLVVSLLSPALGLGGIVYFICAMLGGSWLLIQAVQLFRTFSRPRARKLFIATILYLPLIMCALLLDLLFKN
ncbi:heme o synthase [Lacimicrobium alkaliphilum]|uniref:Protoheme IX farnesyltransferase n=1 Tax=Lacimicrobium alkaliphilum TaxID=1526571 RepID=A0ABQ1RBX9_9ALTE|nr:heme o synthase [Lacimicrobium alkaliphilum]GGD65264.1 protoheme IX farnesyltransferase [Lacimicrobium alkaliphilum]